MSQYTVQSILFNFSHLFILCKILGIYPHNLQIFQQYRELKKSTIGTICVIGVLIVITVLYNFLIYSLSDGNAWKKSEKESTLTFVIGIFLTYIGLAMMSTDQLTAICNQKRLGQLYDRIRMVDERLLREGCWIHNTNLRKQITIMLAVVFGCEITIMLSSYIVLIDYTKWQSLLWIFSSFPTLYNSLDKIWFAVTLYGLQERFAAINKALNDMAEYHERYKMSSSDYGHGVQEENINFLYAELSGASNIKTAKKNRIIPVAPVPQSSNNINDFSSKTDGKAKIIHESEIRSNLIKVEEKLNNFCQVHDELCEIGKMLNELWSYPILVLMAHGFLIFTSQLYFLYCASQNQDIPALFLSAKNAFITAIFLTYSAGKCIYLIYLSWKTSLQAKLTGICLHKCGVVVDNSDLYEIINHLSLKLLNHIVDVTAGGCFSLNMETLYGVSGGISSYLIILIQFNVAAQQAREAIMKYALSRVPVINSGGQPNTTPFEGLTTSFEDLTTSFEDLTTPFEDLLASNLSTALTTDI